MSIKAELRRELNEIGYELGPFTSRDTLSLIKYLHLLVLDEKNINIAKLNDIEIQKSLIQHGLIVGPITQHTRSIYQRKLLEVLTKCATEGQEDEFEIDESVHQTLDDNDERDSSNLNIFPTTQSSSRYASQNSNLEHSQNTEPMIIRHDYKGISSRQNIYENSEEIRSRFSTKSNGIKRDFTLQKVKEKSANENDSLKIARKGQGTFFYATITIIVALTVFFTYLWFEK